MSDKENLQPLEENEAAEKEEKNFEYDRTLCSLCQKKAREEGSYYGEDCRTKMMKTKMNSLVNVLYVVPLKKTRRKRKRIAELRVVRPVET